GPRGGGGGARAPGGRGEGAPAGGPEERGACPPLPGRPDPRSTGEGTGNAPVRGARTPPGAPRSSSALRAEAVHGRAAPASATPDPRAAGRRARAPRARRGCGASPARPAPAPPPPPPPRLQVPDPRRRDRVDAVVRELVGHHQPTGPHQGADLRDSGLQRRDVVQ